MINTDRHSIDQILEDFAANKRLRFDGGREWVSGGIPQAKLLSVVRDTLAPNPLYLEVITQLETEPHLGMLKHQ